MACTGSNPKGYEQFESNVPNVRPEMLYPDFWIKDGFGKILMTEAEINDFNRRLCEKYPVPFELEQYPASITKEKLLELVNKASAIPAGTLYDAQGEPLSPQYWTALAANLNTGGAADFIPVRFGLTVRRTEMRRLPGAGRVFDEPGDYEFDCLIETAVYPAEPLAILHTSKDGQWYFAQMYNYLAWIPAADVAVGSREEVLGFAGHNPFLVVTGSRVRTNYNPFDASLSELPLYMGVRLPLAGREEIPASVNNHNPAGNFVVKLPVRDERGNLVTQLAFIPRTSDVSPGYLPYTTENVLRQAFKAQGERYGWGGMFNARDCSALVMDTFATMGLKLPRNAGEQEHSFGKYCPLPEAMPLEERSKLFDGLEPGTTLYSKGHVMLYLGKHGQEYYMIHALSRFCRQEGGELKEYKSRETLVTPLLSIYTAYRKIFMEALTGVRQFVMP